MKTTRTVREYQKLKYNFNFVIHSYNILIRAADEATLTVLTVEPKVHKIRVTGLLLWYITYLRSLINRKKTKVRFTEQNQSL